MNTERLVAMANDIAAFFDSELDKDAAAKGIVTHLRRYWDPRMRSGIIMHLRSGGTGLTDLSRSAIIALAAKL